MKGICVGMGSRGQQWYRWAQTAGMEVMGVVDLNETLLHEAAEALGVPPEQRFTTIAQAARATGAACATVCTANSAHFTCIRECLDAGLHCLVEKPMVESIEQARAVVALSHQTGLTVAVAHNYRYSREVRTMRQAVREGLIGQVLHLNVTFARWRPAGRMALPLMLNQAIHHFDAARAILGADPTWCFARSWNPQGSPSSGPTMLQGVWGMAGEDTAATHDNGERETVFTYSGNYVQQGQETPYSGQWRLEGATGTLTYLAGGTETGVVLTRRDPAQRIELPMRECPESEPASVCRDFLQAVAAGTVPHTAARDNIKSLAMVWAAQQASDHRKVVHVPDLIV